MDIRTKYMGMDLKSPLVAGASPICDNIDNIKKLEDAGASALVLLSLFQEQVIQEQKEILYHSIVGNYISPESTAFFPEPDEYRHTPDEYLNLIRKAKSTVAIPVIGSLNGANAEGWTDFAAKIEEAGADGLELNIYYIPTDFNLSGSEIENNYINIIKSVKSAVKIPVAVKLSPFFSNMANMARRIDEAGADALVLFNRFYQPDIDLEELVVKPHIVLSNPLELRLPLRWIAILKGRIKAGLAATSGVHGYEDVLKAIMAGADVVQLASALLQHGIGHLTKIETDLVRWMEEKEYKSIKQMQGSLSQQKNADPSAYERAQYMKALSGYKF